MPCFCSICTIVLHFGHKKAAHVYREPRGNMRIIIYYVSLCNLLRVAFDGFADGSTYKCIELFAARFGVILKPRLFSLWHRQLNYIIIVLDVFVVICRFIKFLAVHIFTAFDIIIPRYHALVNV